MFTNWTLADALILPTLLIPVVLLVRCRKAWAQVGVLASMLVLLIAGGEWGGPVYELCACYVVPAMLLVDILLLVSSWCWQSWGRCRVPVVPAEVRYPKGKVLVVAPHQDDEILLAGGLLEDLVQTCEVHILFSTNGDFNAKRHLSHEKKGYRMQETLRAMQAYGIPADWVHFMGFGNEWQPDRTGQFGEQYLHLYHATPDAVQRSFSGEKETWGTKVAPCLRAGVPYTRRNFVEILREVLAQLRPDTIICVDYDVHADHRALSLFFEEALAAEMKRTSSYAPFVLKTFAYSCCWNTPRDFYRENLLSTPRPMEGDNMREVPAYRWSERLRIPISKSCVTRVLPGNLIYESYMQHASQAIPLEGVKERIINGDKVYWWRPTGNVLLHAQISADSGDSAALNDFLLTGSGNITNPDDIPNAHGWFPEAGKARACFTLKHPGVLNQIRLYAVASTENRVLNARITLSNGRILETGPLPENGSPLELPTKCLDPLDGFTLELTQTNGTHPGLAEVEAYATPPQPRWQVLKLQTADGHFMYDYTVPRSGELSFSLYTWPGSYSEKWSVVALQNGQQTEVFPHEDGLYHLHVDYGSEVELRVYSPDQQLRDAARVQNPRIRVRAFRHILRKADKRMRAAVPITMGQYYRFMLSQLFK